MGELPRVVKQWAQPTTSARKPKHGKHRSTRVTFDTPGSEQQRIVFTGTLRRTHHAFSVLAGDSAPTLTGGFAKWTEIERPQRTSLTIIEGYGALTLIVPILFDVVVLSGPIVTANLKVFEEGKSNYALNEVAQGLEDDIQILEWMGGRGALCNEEGRDGTGQSPLVNVYSVSSTGREHPLIPPNAQGINWIITNITYDTHPLRNADGYRIRQGATVELKQYEGAPFDVSSDSAVARYKARNPEKGHIVFQTTQAVNTILRLASLELRLPKPGQAATEIVNYNRKRKDWKWGASTMRALPIGTIVWVPKALAHGLG